MAEMETMILILKVNTTRKSFILHLSIICTLLSIAYTPTLFAQDQKNAKKVIELNTDNDAFVIWENLDRYYTYGVGLNVYFKPNKFLGLQKLFPNKQDFFLNLGIKSEGYAATKQGLSQNVTEEDIRNADYPFAGLLFGRLESAYIFKTSFIKTEYVFGVMGPLASSKEIQDWVHNNITDDDLIDGWKYQIPNQLILNINVSGVYDLKPNSSIFNVYLKGETRLGNLYIDATPTIGLRFGKIEPLVNSTSVGNAILANKQEIFIRSTFSATATAFNATAQANLFKHNDYSVADYNHFYTSMSHGIFYTGNKFTLGFDHVFTFGKYKDKVRHIYGNFSCSYRF